MSKKQDTQDEVVKPLGLQDIADLSPPSAPSSPSPVANVSMKLPAPQQVQKLLEEFPDVISSDGFTDIIS